MARGKFKIAKQIGEKGFFGEVVLTAEPQNRDGQVSVEFDEERAARWQNGARCGVDFVLEHLPVQTMFPSGLKIRVETIEGHDVDTDSALIAAVTIQALLNALEIHEPMISFHWDEKEGSLILHKEDFQFAEAAR